MDLNADQHLWFEIFFTDITGSDISSLVVWRRSISVPFPGFSAFSCITKRHQNVFQSLGGHLRKLSHPQSSSKQNLSHSLSSHSYTFSLSLPLSLLCLLFSPLCALQISLVLGSLKLAITYFLRLGEFLCFYY